MLKDPSGIEISIHNLIRIGHPNITGKFQIFVAKRYEDIAKRKSVAFLLPVGTTWYGNKYLSARI